MGIYAVIPTSSTYVSIASSSRRKFQVIFIQPMFQRQNLQKRPQNARGGTHGSRRKFQVILIQPTFQHQNLQKKATECPGGEHMAQLNPSQHPLKNGFSTITKPIQDAQGGNCSTSVFSNLPGTLIYGKTVKEDMREEIGGNMKKMGIKYGT